MNCECYVNLFLSMLMYILLPYVCIGTIENYEHLTEFLIFPISYGCACISLYV